jgi:hypothetical protein
MNVVIAAAKKYRIEPFASLDVPRLTEFDSRTHQQFRADLDHILRIRSYCWITAHQPGADDLDEAKRQILLRRIAEFEAELEKQKLSLISVTILAITLLGAPGAIWASAVQQISC